MVEYITDKQYWDNFWQTYSLPQTVDLNFSNDRIIAEFIRENVPFGSGSESALEIGCAPGKWMIFLGQEMKYVPEGCEYLHSAVEVTEKNLRMNGQNTGGVHEGDFLTSDFDLHSYDLVISLGFLEHFSDPGPVIEKMLKIIKPGGVLLIGIPKLSGINYYIAKQVDKTLKDQLLPRHNLKIMNCRFFEQAASDFHLKTIKIACAGGFEPALYDISRSPLWFKMVFYLTLILFHNRVARWFSAEWYSSYILAAYTCP
jgi:SAM-dependent methyltransferase